MNHVPPIFRDGFRLYLGPIEKDDIPFIYRSINNPNIHQYLTIDFPMSLEDEYQWYESLSKEKNEQVVFAIRLKTSGELMGVIGLHSIKWIDRRATLGYYIAREDMWGKGYGTEAVMIAMEYAFSTLNLNKIEAEVCDFNPGSLRCLIKCGFEKQGSEPTLRQHRYRNGRYVDCHLLHLFRPRFEEVWGQYRAKQTILEKESKQGAT